MTRPKAQRQAEDDARATALRASVAHVAFLAGVSSASVVDAMNGGNCPRNADGSLSWPEVRAWAQANGRLGYAKPKSAPAAAPGGGPGTDWKGELERMKALEARRAYEEATGKLIPKDDAMRAQIRLALEFKAALVALPQQLAMALANLPAREVEAALRERVQWILSRSQDGNVPIPRDLVDAIAKLVAERFPSEART